MSLKLNPHREISFERMRKVVAQFTGRDAIAPGELRDALIDLAEFLPALLEAYIKLTEASPITRESLTAWLERQSRDWFSNACHEAEKQRFDNGAAYKHYAAILRGLAEAVEEGESIDEDSKSLIMPGEL